MSDPVSLKIRGEGEYEVKGLLWDQGFYQIAHGVDGEGNPVAFRAALYEEDEEREPRRRELVRQWEFLKDLGETGRVPRPVEKVIAEEGEPMVVMELVEGESLYDVVTGRRDCREGMEPTQALSLVAEILEVVTAAHEKGWLIRDFDPRRFWVDGDGPVRLVSTSRVVRRGMPLEAFQLETSRAYVAPEVRDEMTGTMQRRSADLYGLGALLSFLVTGEEPRDRVESPLSFQAFERLQAWELPGQELLIARLLQPLAKKRLGRAERLKPFLSVESLPTREMKGFEMTMLPAPWLGLEMENPEENRGLRSQLSEGPLVSVEGGQDDEQWGLNWPLVVFAVVVVVLALFFALLSGG